MNNIVLIEPTLEHQKIIMNYRQEYIQCGETWINGSYGLINFDDYNKWLDAIQNKKQIVPSNIDTPATTFILLDYINEIVIGTVQLRHFLTEELKNHGGNIGYGICPSYRKRGYGKLQLTLILEKARDIGLKKVMISCDKSNIASENLIRSCNGIFSHEIQNICDNEPIKVFWIAL